MSVQNEPPAALEGIDASNARMGYSRWGALQHGLPRHTSCQRRGIWKPEFSREPAQRPQPNLGATGRRSVPQSPMDRRDHGRDSNRQTSWWLPLLVFKSRLGKLMGKLESQSGVSGSVA